jgi:hypothetical protein
MNRKLFIRLVFFVGLYIALVVGLFAQLPGLMLAYLCLAPFAGIWLGRASIGVLKGRFRLVSEREEHALRQLRERQAIRQ